MTNDHVLLVIYNSYNRYENSCLSQGNQQKAAKFLCDEIIQLSTAHQHRKATTLGLHQHYDTLVEEMLAHDCLQFIARFSFDSLRLKGINDVDYQTWFSRVHELHQKTRQAFTVSADGTCSSNDSLHYPKLNWMFARTSIVSEWQKNGTIFQFQLKLQQVQTNLNKNSIETLVESNCLMWIELLYMMILL